MCIIVGKGDLQFPVYSELSGCVCIIVGKGDLQFPVYSELSGCVCIIVGECGLQFPVYSELSGYLNPDSYMHCLIIAGCVSVYIIT